MKKLLLILLIVLTSFSLSAQKIHFADTTNVWNEIEYLYNGLYPPISFYLTYAYVTDTTIGSVEYRNFSFGTIREDTFLKKVYVRDFTGDSDIVLLDYNLKVGDTFTTNKFVVVRIDSTLINAVWHKVWYFSSVYAHYIADPVYVIEGIGCIQHPTYLLFDFGRCVECEMPKMYCFSQNGIKPAVAPSVAWLDNTTSCSTFLSPLSTSQSQISQDKINIFPNPTTSELTITSSDNITSMSISNLVGNSVYTRKYNATKVQVDVSALPVGMYLVKINGTEVKKFVKE